MIVCKAGSNRDTHTHLRGWGAGGSTGWNELGPAFCEEHGLFVHVSCRIMTVKTKTKLLEPNVIVLVPYRTYSVRSREQLVLAQSRVVCARHVPEDRQC